ncbi:MAG: DUF2062 domain-containing protein [Gammaproteobacteria bacterium]|nr:DUF2062 domain-containing protein [Gammaproteobacteria bacterium]
MPRRFFRKFAVKRDALRRQWYLAPFAHLLHDSRLWSIRRRTVVPAFSLGLFVAYLPFPGHPVQAALLAVLLKVNIPIAAVTTFVSNPLTIGPMFYLAYKIGSTLLGLPPQPLDFELNIAWFMEKFVTVWQPMLLGCVLLGSTISVLGYVALDIFWRLSLADYLARRRARKLQKDRSR